jgi:Phospholipase_D-nuclease N-terminal
MLFFDGGLALVAFAVWLFCIIDVITTPDGEARNLPKLVWLLLVIILVDVGSIAWLIAGRPWASRPADLPYKGNRGRAEPPRRRMNGTNPDDDEEFLARLRDRAEEQRRRARDAQRGEEEPPATG